jgi:hypothetical protein
MVHGPLDRETLAKARVPVFLRGSELLAAELDQHQLAVLFLHQRTADSDVACICDNHELAVAFGRAEHHIISELCADEVEGTLPFFSPFIRNTAFQQIRETGED